MIPKKIYDLLEFIESKHNWFLSYNIFNKAKLGILTKKLTRKLQWLFTQQVGNSRYCRMH
jgi:hypothetical protein